MGSKIATAFLWSLLVIIAVIASVALALSVKSKSEINNRESNPSTPTTPTTPCADTMTVFVNQGTGSDSATGKSSDSALKSVDQAINTILAADMCKDSQATIQLMGTSYNVKDSTTWATAVSEEQSRGIQITISGSEADVILHTGIVESSIAQSIPETVLEINLTSNSALSSDFTGSLVKIGTEMFTCRALTPTKIVVMGAGSLILSQMSTVTFVIPGTTVVFGSNFSVIAVGDSDELVFSNIVLEPNTPNTILAIGWNQTLPLLQTVFTGKVLVKDCYLRVATNQANNSFSLEATCPTELNTCVIEDEILLSVHYVKSMLGGMTLNKCMVLGLNVKFENIGEFHITNTTIAGGNVDVIGVSAHLVAIGSVFDSQNSRTAPLNINDGAHVECLSCASYNSNIGNARVIMLTNTSTASLTNFGFESVGFCFSVGTCCTLTIVSMTAFAVVDPDAQIMGLGFASRVNIASGIDSLVGVSNGCTFSIPGGKLYPVTSRPSSFANANTSLSVYTDS